MRKIISLLACVAFATNIFAIVYTSKAKVTLTSGSGYSCELMLSESAEYGALTGSIMYMEDREVALYVLDGATKLQIARASDFSGVKVGLMTDASTSYTLDVSLVEGTETMYLYDMEAGAAYALTKGASYDFTATANSTIEDRFVLNLPVPAGNLETCFTGTELQITNNPIFGKIVVKRKSDKSTVHEYEFGTSSITMNTSTGYADGDYIVEFGSGASQRSFIVTVKN